MFTKVEKYSTDIYLAQHSKSIKSSVLLGMEFHKISTDRLTGSVNSNFLDLLLAGNPSNKYYFLLPWPKSILKYILVFFTLFGVLSLVTGEIVGFIFSLAVIYSSTKIVGSQILSDVALKSYKRLPKRDND